MQSLKIICPNGHLGFAPLKTGSFHLGVAAGPDCIAADSGSDDVGPVPLGSDTSTSPEQWQRHDLREIGQVLDRESHLPDGGLVVGHGALQFVDFCCAAILPLRGIERHSQPPPPRSRRAPEGYNRGPVTRGPSPMSIWFRSFTLDELNQQSRGCMVALLDIRYTEIGPDYVRATMPVDA